ncbi:MAG: sigma-70 family polymerase sigma factor [Acidimicrobiales bacterium]|nr:sigma-70 family polymerase sigma factor [Acidimicrobiales bacterium]
MDTAIHGEEPARIPTHSTYARNVSSLREPVDATAPRAAGALDADFEAHRRELTAHCYRMLGSGFEAEDAVQETMVRAWRSAEAFEGRSSVRSWLYRIATNVCIDMLRGPQRRARPMDLGPSGTADAALDAGLPGHTWVEPVPDGSVLAEGGDPGDVAAARDGVRLAFVAALQLLPPRQRAVLILREVLRWKAEEVAVLLDTSVPAVNSALQRARATLDTTDAAELTTPPTDPGQRELLDRYVQAFEAYDITSLVALLHDDATFCMPPFALWLRGPVEVGRFLVGTGAGCRGSRLVPTAANGCAAFGSYKPVAPGVHEPWALQVLEVSGGRISGWHNFLDAAALFPAFGLPLRLEQ